MKKMPFLFVCLSMYLLAIPAEAADATFNVGWTAPTTRTDGTVLTSGEIKEYRVYHAVDAEVKQGPVYTVVTVGTETPLVINLEPRPLEPYIISYAVSAVDQDGLESGLSAVGMKSYLVKSTAAVEVPTGLVVNIVSCDGCTITEQ